MNILTWTAKGTKKNQNNLRFQKAKYCVQDIWVKRRVRIQTCSSHSSLFSVSLCGCTGLIVLRAFPGMQCGSFTFDLDWLSWNTDKSDEHIWVPAKWASDMFFLQNYLEPMPSPLVVCVTTARCHVHRGSGCPLVCPSTSVCHGAGPCLLLLRDKSAWISPTSGLWTSSSLTFLV